VVSCASRKPASELLQLVWSMTARIEVGICGNAGVYFGPQEPGARMCWGVIGA